MDNRGECVTAHLTKEQRALAHRLRRKGYSLRRIARDIGLNSPGGVQHVLLGQKREGREVTWSPRARRLTLDEREEIALGLRAGESMRSLARRLSRALDDRPGGESERRRAGLPHLAVPRPGEGTGPTPQDEEVERPDAVCHSDDVAREVLVAPGDRRATETRAPR